VDPDVPEPLPDVATFPNARDTLRPGARGTVATIAGQEWCLADYPPDFSAVWDHLFDANALTGQYDPIDLRSAAAVLILACHDISPRDAVALVWRCYDEVLVAAVEAAMFGPTEPDRGWSSWCQASLLAAGLDPDRVPKPQLLDVLELLVLTGRAVPAERWISSVAVAREKAAADQIRSQFRAMARPNPEPPSEPAAADPFSFAGPPE
jgi:hypothetical protein